MEQLHAPAASCKICGPSSGDQHAQYGHGTRPPAANIQKNFILVRGQLFVPSSLNSIRVFDVKAPRYTIPVGIRTTFRTGKAFNRIRLVHIGADYIELLAKDKNRSRILLPLNKVEGIYRVK